MSSVFAVLSSALEMLFMNALDISLFASYSRAVSSERSFYLVTVFVHRLFELYLLYVAIFEKNRFFLVNLFRFV